MTPKKPPATPKAPAPPAGLGDTGQAMWKAMTAVFVFQPHEAFVLESACRQADDVAMLEASIAETGATVIGSTGQERMNAMVTEARQGRLAMSKLLGDLALPAIPDDADGSTGAPQTIAQRRAARAANTRWAAEGGR